MSKAKDLITILDESHDLAHKTAILSNGDKINLDMGYSGGRVIGSIATWKKNKKGDFPGYTWIGKENISDEEEGYRRFNELVKKGKGKVIAVWISR